ncbi:hypothetical protein [Luteithermobacter gelatinilyticus]|uniref:hypothetical protein n=1 Tax=Luteithermobacter gelatinilyticus TaxID=2582913 RepID=UPI001105F58E|nr:hypothetical protein [Luteithermobacter gelatinilyticus]
MIDSHNVLTFIHIILMGYWLGGDLGVYLAANRVSDPALPLKERLDFLHLALKLDMAPRTALILMLPVGFHMAANLDMADLSATPLVLIWAVGLAWLALTWAVYLQEGHPIGEKLRRIDLLIRYVMLVLITGYGLYGLVGASEGMPPWLAVKLLFFGGIILLGLLLRIQVGAWARGFMMLREGGPSREAENIIRMTRRKASQQALLLWLFILICGFLGVTQFF